MKIVITVEVPDGAAVSVDTPAAAPSAPATPAKARATKATTATPSAPPVAAPAQAVATAPAAATVQSAPEAPTLKAVNDKVSILAGLDRDVAVEILVKHGANKVKTSTAQLKPDVYQVVLDETEEAIDRINAAATQVANSGSLV